MASSKGGFSNTNKRAKKHASLVKTLNRKRNLEGATKKKGSSNG
jgi:hypothetical protein